MEAGSIIALVLGSVALFIVLIALYIFYMRRYSRRDKGSALFAKGYKPGPVGRYDN